MSNVAGTLLTMAAGASACIFGLVYLIRPEFMSYHKKAVQQGWDELGPEVRTILLALMRAVSGGFLAVAATLFILQWEYMRNHEPWVPHAILVIGSILAFGSFYAMLLVRFRTKGRPPLIPVIIMYILLLAGYFCNIYG